MAGVSGGFGVSEIERTAFDLAYGQLRAQKADLQFFRGQAAFAAAVSGIIASVFSSIVGEKLISPEMPIFLGLDAVGWLVVGSFSLSVGFAVKAFMGWSTCTFDLNPNTAIYYIEHQMSHEELLCRLAKDADAYFDKNEEIITQTRHSLGMALICSWCQIPAWLLLVLI
jgi:hypothetical protein